MMRTAGDIQHQDCCSAKELIFLFAYLLAHGELSVWHFTRDIDSRLCGMHYNIYSGESASTVMAHILNCHAVLEFYAKSNKSSYMMPLRRHTSNKNSI